MNVIWTSKARRDLRRIHDRIESLSEGAGSRLAAAITERTAQVEQFPDSGRMMPEFQNRYIRELVEGEYRIVYERFPDRVEVIAVVHGAMSFQPQPRRN